MERDAVVALTVRGESGTTRVVDVHDAPDVHGAAASVIIKRLTCSSLSESNPAIGVSSLLGDPLAGRSRERLIVSARGVKPQAHCH